VYHVAAMQAAKLLTLIAVFFITSIISVVTGSTSLITVPVMIQRGIEPRVAVATNMFALDLLECRRIDATLDERVSCFLN
jgi:hypothetical protein